MPFTKMEQIISSYDIERILPTTEAYECRFASGDSRVFSD